MELKFKIKALKFKYDKLKTTKQSNYLSKIMFILEVKSLLTATEYAGKFTLEEENELKAMIEDMQYKVLNNLN